MSGPNKFCIICGKHLIESEGGDICSDNCNDYFNDFKSNPNLTSINGFCNFCGDFHKLKKNSVYGAILHRHNKCYSVYSYFSKSPLQIEMNRKEKEEELRRQLEEEKELEKSYNKVYDSDSNLLFCSYCNNYSVEYLVVSHKP